MVHWRLLDKIQCRGMPTHYLYKPGWSYTVQLVQKPGVSPYYTYTIHHKGAITVMTSQAKRLELIHEMAQNRIDGILKVLEAEQCV